MKYIFSKIKPKLIIVCIIMIFILFLYLIRNIIIEVAQPIIFALLIAYLLNPLINKLERNKISRFTSILIIYLLFIFIICMFFIFLAPELIKSMKDLIIMMPDFFERIQVYFYELMIRYNHSGLPAAIKNTIEANIYKIEGYIINSIQSVIGSITSIFDFLFDFIVGAVLAFYFLKDIKMFERICISLVPRKSRDWVLDMIRDMDMVLSGFIRGQVFIAIILSTMTSIGLKLIGLRYFLLLGIIAGFGEIIPYFGPILGIIPAIIAAFILKPLSAVWVIVLYFILQQLEGAILSPKIMGNRVGLHPVTVILSVLIGGKFFGMVGLIFAVPIAGIIKVITKRIIQSIA